jgi:hypothetical protein
MLERMEQRRLHCDEHCRRKENPPEPGRSHRLTSRAPRR